VKKSGMPREGEVVICRVSSVNPNSVFARIEEYDKEGMIHVSEVASRWVRDIREFVRENQMVVCRVTRIDGDHISLSIKRVSREEAASRLNEYKREKKSEKLLELTAKEMGMKLDKAYDEIGNDLIETFGSLTKAFDMAAKGAEVLLKHGVKKDWAKALAEVAAKSKTAKGYETKAMLELVSYRPDGVDAIKAALSKLPKDVEVKYISAPRYLLVKKGTDRRLMEAELEKAAASVVEELKRSSGSGSFKIVSE